MKQDSKKAKMRMMTYKEIKEKYGEKEAKEIRARKYEQERTRNPDLVPDPWCMEHPELPKKEAHGG